MLDRMPLGAVRVFVTVARLLSVTKAAEQLNVSPSAVSHQIKAVEDYLSTRLFDRTGHKLKLTASGERFMMEASQGVFLIARAMNNIKRDKERSLLRIRAPIGLASLWLMERVGRFMKSNPHINCTFAGLAESPERSGVLFDIGFRYGGANLSGISCYALGGDAVFPICRPSLVKGENGLRDPAALARCTLIDSIEETYRDNGEPKVPGWTTWLSAAGYPELVVKRYLNVTPRLLVHHAVGGGHGVGLSRTLLAADALRSKQLTLPFGPILEQPFTYRIIVPTALSKNKDVSAFRDWVLEEARASTQLVGKHIRRVNRNIGTCRTGFRQHT